MKSVVQLPNIPDIKLYNEPVLNYRKGSSERTELEKKLKEAASTCEDIPIVIGNEEFRTNQVRCQVMPHDHSKNIAAFYYADQALIEKAIKVAVEAQKKWDRVPFDERVKIWNRAADLMAGEYRQTLNAATMLGQSKTAIQAEIDASAELIDFIRMNTAYLKDNLKYQPISEDASVTKNLLRHRGIDGFIAAVSPFNFTAIGGNLAYTPALMVRSAQFMHIFYSFSNASINFIISLQFASFCRAIQYYGSHPTPPSFRIGQYSRLCERPAFQLV